MPPTTWRSVQLINIPDAAPPYDCETHGAACPVARDQAGPVARDQAGPVARDQAGPVARDQAGAADLAAPAAGPVAAAPAGPEVSPGATLAWPRQFAQVMVEILAGVRPQRQIGPWTTDRVLAQIRHLGPVLAADRRPRIQRVVTSRPTASVVEMAVVVGTGSRSRALAMRLEYVAAKEAAPGLPTRPARWLCTELEAG